MKRNMFLALLCALFLTACGQKQVEINAAPGEISFSGFSAMDFSGNVRSEEVFSERKLTMINIWATTCGPCVEEMPALVNLNVAYGEDFQVIGIPVDVVDRNLMKIQDRVKKAEEMMVTADYLHLVPSKSLMELHLSQVQLVPETIFVDSTGRQIGDVYPGAKSEEEWAEIIEALLEQMK